VKNAVAVFETFGCKNNQRLMGQKLPVNG